MPGRIRLLGTPATSAGAYEDVHACFTTHTAPSQFFKASFTGTAYGISLSISKFTVSFKGKPVNAALALYQVVYALDAVSVAYSAIGLHCQQIKEHERIHFIIENGGAAANVIPVAATSENQHHGIHRYSRIRGSEANFGTALECDSGKTTAGAGSTDQGDMSCVFPLSMLIQYRDRARSMGPSAGFTAAAGSDGAFLTRPLKAWHVQRGIFSRMML
ncbi:amidohydrolase [Penicillium canescens]|uniref:amidohydrolase n=1 Tax=Penicillium canescens TaxID=5083 RepID=UPI0026DEC8E6|nr:amidohydrolase [Penicillium canescens]KAJ6048326.1 amidohydrolase [Penicillium canescens]